MLDMQNILLLCHLVIWHTSSKGQSKQAQLLHNKCVRLECMQIGWETGPSTLINAIAKAHQFLVFTVPSNLQRAVAHGLDHESSFFT